MLNDNNNNNVLNDNDKNNNGNNNVLNKNNKKCCLCNRKFASLYLPKIQPNISIPTIKYRATNQSTVQVNTGFVTSNEHVKTKPKVSKPLEFLEELWESTKNQMIRIQKNLKYLKSKISSSP